MNLDYSDEQRALRLSLRTLLDSEIAMRGRAGWDGERWQALARGGFLRVGLPLRVGGSGGPIETMIVLSELGWALAADAYLETLVIAAPLLANAPHAGFDELVTRIANGGALVAIAWDDPSEREDSTMSLIVTPTAGGWRLNGRRSIVAGAAAAGHWIVEAHTDEYGGARALFILDRNVTGVERVDYATIDGRSCSHVTFVDVLVGAQQLVAGPDTAQVSIDRAMDHAIAAHCAEAVGLIRRMLADTVDHCKRRQQFGQPLSSFQVLQHRLVDMELQNAMASSATLRASLSLDLPASERARATSAAKVTVASACRFVGENAVQLHGGLGMRDDTPVTRYFRRATAMETEFGGIDWHLTRFAGQIAAAPSQP